MKKRTKASRVISERKAPKTCRLAASKIAKARAILGAPTDTAAIEMALDLVSFRSELIEGTKALRGTLIEPFGGPRP
jgi:hypothetical protein